MRYKDYTGIDAGKPLIRLTEVIDKKYSKQQIITLRGIYGII